MKQDSSAFLMLISHSLTHSLIPFSQTIYLFLDVCHILSLITHAMSYCEKFCLLYKDDILLCVDIVDTSMHVWKISKFMSWQSHAKLLNLYSKYAFSGYFVP